MAYPYSIATAGGREFPYKLLGMELAWAVASS